MSMQTESISRQILRHRAWLAAGVLIAVLAAVAATHEIRLNPPSLKRESAEFASATTQVFIDSPSPSSLFDLERNLVPLAERANVYSRLMTSPAVLRDIGRKADIPPGEIDAKGPFNVNQPRVQREPTAERRANQLRLERRDYRLRFDSEPDLPLVTIIAKAPTVGEATRLADGAATGLRTYVANLQRQLGLKGSEAVAIRQLGRAEGGVVNPGVDRQIAIVAFFSALMAWTLLVALVAALTRRLRGRAEGAETGTPYGAGSRRRQRAAAAAIRSIR